MRTGILFLLCLVSTVTFVDSAYFQLRATDNPCSTADIEQKRSQMNRDLTDIRNSCEGPKRQQLFALLQSAVDKASSLHESVLDCLQNAISLINAAFQKLQTALDTSCDVGVIQQSNIDFKFNRIIAELQSCVQNSNGCCQCQKDCCIEKRNQYYQDIDTEIATLKQQYSACITRTCRTINQDIDQISNAIDDCAPAATTVAPVTEEVDYTTIDDCPETTTYFVDTTTTSSSVPDTTPTSTPYTRRTTTPHYVPTTSTTNTPPYTEEPTSNIYATTEVLLESSTQ